MIFGAILFGCPSDQSGSQNVQPTENGSKITSLQAVIDSDEVKDGDEIDLSQYKDITDFNYNATINKSITIKNGNDLKGAALNVVTDGVKLDGINKASVTTQSSLKISGSSLSSLNIGEVPRGRGDNKINPPTVEITDNSSVTNTVTVAIENAQMSVKSSSAGKIELKGMNTQLTIEDKDTRITSIETDTICQVILTDGTSDKLPQRPTVKGSGELTQIDMSVAADITLIALTPMSGLKSAVKKGGLIDFTDVVMLGTYTASNGITVFRANLTEEFTDTFSRLEKNFVVKFGNNKDVIFKDGIPTNFAWTANVGTFNAYIVSEYEPQAENCEYQFEITVLDVDGDNDELPTFELKSITAQKGTAKTDYTVGDLLDLRGIIVLGEYEASPTMKYNGIVTDYTLNPSNGTPLTTVGKQNVTITAEGKTDTIEITVNEAKPQIKRYAVQFNSNGGSGTMANQDMTCDVSADLTANTFTRTGYTFQGWAETSDGEVKYANQAKVVNLATANGTIVPLYAVWTANQYTVTLWNDGDVSGDISVTATYDTIVPTITKPSKTGYTFGGYWTQANGQGSQYIDTDGKGKKWDIAENTTLYAYFMERGTHFIYYYNTKGAANLTNPQPFREAEAITLPTINADGYQFDGWYDSSTDFTDDHHLTDWAAGAKTDNVSLWAKWTAQQVNYTVKYLFQNVAGNGYDVSGDIVTKTGLTDTSTDVNAENNITGFDLLPIVQQNIAGNGSTVVEIKYNRKTITYTFKANGGNWDDNSTADKTAIGLYGAAVNKPANPTRTGYSFSGWNTDGGTIPNNFDETTDFTALWTAEQYDITYKDGNSDTFTGVFENDTKPTKHTYGQDTTLVNPTKEHYQFGGWYIASDCSGSSIPTLLATGYTEPITLYAKWTEKQKYTVKFNSNTKPISPNTTVTQQIYIGEETALTSFAETGFSKDGYTFLRWCDHSYGVGRNYNNQATVTDLTGDGGTITLYAIWKYDTYNSYTNEDGNIVINGKIYGYTSFAQVMDSPTEITGSNDNWISYCDSSASASYKGAFIVGRDVKLSPYRICKYEVTQSLYAAVMGKTQNAIISAVSGTNKGTGDNYPIYYVSWYDAITFCNKLSLLMGKTPCYSVKANDIEKDWANLAYAEIPDALGDATDDWNAATVDMSANGYRLPTEAEWEFAARGGDPSMADWRFAFSGVQSQKQIYRETTETDMDYGGTNRNLRKDDNLSTVGWYLTSMGGSTHPVGSLNANRLGLCDMSGNLSEWCWDWYNGTVTSNDTAWTKEGIVTNPLGPGDGSNRCLRGGDWDRTAFYCSVSYRYNKFSPNTRDNNTGFRLVCSGE